jgi:lysophospholipase L1-like esterase
VTRRTKGDGEGREDLLGREREGTLLSEVASLDAPEHAIEDTWKALRHLAVASAVVAVLALVPYASEDLVRFRAWMPGDGVPVARLFDDREARVTGMELATGGAVRGGGRARLAEQLGGDVAANLDVEPAPPVQQQESTSGDGPRVRIDPSELEGLVREIEDPSGRAMRPFYEALLRTAEREPGAITRVAHYGDSSIAGDGITSTLRRRFQQRFGDAGHGFLLIARGTMPYRHQDVRHQSNDEWRLIELVRAGLRDRRYGYGGVQYRSASGGTARFATVESGPIGTRVSRFELWFQRHERGGNVDLRVDGGERVVVETRGESQRDDWHVIDVPDGPHRLELRTIGGGESRLYGMVMERAGPGVVYDSLGMVGARGRRMLGFDPQHFAEQHARRATNLIVLAFGGNDADDTLTPEQFESEYRRIARMVRRARPEAACLLMAPLDQAQRDERGNIVTLEPLPIIVEAQRRAAAAEGCAFFDTYAAMGGEGSMRRWFRANPRLAFGDYRHATPAGYAVIGNMLYKALLKGFADFLDAERAAR